MRATMAGSRAAALAALASCAALAAAEQGATQGKSRRGASANPSRCCPGGATTPLPRASRAKVASTCCNCAVPPSWPPRAQCTRRVSTHGGRCRAPRAPPLLPEALPSGFIHGKRLFWVAAAARTQCQTRGGVQLSRTPAPSPHAR